MRYCTPPTAAALLLAALALPSPADAQDRRPAVFRLEIVNGGSRTVRYFGDGLSPGDSALLRDLEGAENQLALARDLTALARQYAASERLLEPVRRQVQQQLYGLDITTSSYATAYDWPATWGTYGRGVPGVNTYLFNPWPAAVPVGGGSVTVNRSLAHGAGDQGPMKEALAKAIAQRASPEGVAALERSRDQLARRAAASEPLRAALRLPRPGEARLAADEAPASPVTLTLKGGDKVRGDAVKETKDWFVVSRPGGGEVRVRASEVVRVETARKGVVPAVDD